MKKICLIAIVGVLLTTTLSAQNSIDAVSSASTNIRIDSGWAYDSTAILYTYTKDSYDRHLIMYGTTKDTPSDTISRPGFPRAVACTLSGLKPETQYFYTFIGGLSTNWPTESHKIAGSFLTTSQAAYITPIKQKRSSYQIAVTGNYLLLPEQNIGEVTVELFALSGRMIMRTMVNTAGSGKSILIPYGYHGVCTAIVRSGSKQITVQKLRIQ